MVKRGSGVSGAGLNRLNTFAGRGRCLAVGSFLFLCLVLVGPAQEPDCAQGFAQLRALGLPDAANATYVRLGGGFSGGMSGFPTRRRLVPKLKGNAWLLEARQDGPSRLIRDQLAVAEVWERRAWTAKQRRDQAAAPAAEAAADTAADFTDAVDDELRVGTWTTVDLDQDIAALLKVLAPPKADAAQPEPEDDADTPGRDNEFEEFQLRSTYVNLFLFAAHCHRVGRTGEANRIVAALFARVPDRASFLGMVLGRLARTQYEEALHAFARDGAWTPWATALDAIETRFRGVWKSAPAVKRLAAELRRRAGDKPPPVTGEGLTPADTELAAALADASGPQALHALARGTSSRWTLREDSDRPATAPPTDPVARLLARGVDAIPLLAALLSDTYLTAMVENGGSFSSFSDEWTEYRAGETDVGDDGNRLYAALGKPQTRGQLAARLLLPVLPTDRDQDEVLQQAVYAIAGEDADSGEAQRQEALDTVRKAALAWHAEARGKTPSQLAVLYLARSAESNQDELLRYLIEHDAEAHAPLIEAEFLKRARSRDVQWLLVSYVQERGLAAKAFVDRFAAAADATAAAPAADAPTPARMFVDGASGRDGPKEIVARLRRLVTPVPLDEQLAAFRAGKLPLRELVESLTNPATTTPLDDGLGAMLQLAVEEKDAAERGQIVAYASHFPYAARQARSRASTVATPGPGTPAKLDPAAHAELWRQLLADDRPPSSPGEDPSDSFGLEPQTVAAAAAGAVLAIYGGPEAKQDLSDEPDVTACAALGSRLQSFYLERARALLGGKPVAELPPFPSADRVTPERRAELAASLRTADPAALARLAPALTTDEILALAETTPKDEALGRTLLPFANQIGKVVIEPADLPGTAVLTELKGQSLSPEIVKQAHALCLALATAGRRLNCTIARAAGLDGVSIRLRELVDPKKPGGQPAAPAPPDEMFEEEQAADDTPVLTGAAGLYSGDESDPAAAFWPITPATPGADADGAAAETKAKPGTAEDRLAAAPRFRLDADPEALVDPEAQARFWALVEGICTNPAKVWYPAQVRFGREAVGRSSRARAWRR